MIKKKYIQLYNFLEQYKQLIFIFIFTYMFTRRLWEPIIGDIYKKAVFIFLLIGIIMYLCNTIFNYNEYRFDKCEKIVIILFIIYSIYIIMNGIYFGNVFRFFKGMKEYIIYPLFLFSSLYYLDGVNLKRNIIYFVVFASIIISLLSIYEILSGQSILPLTIDPYNKTRYYLVYGNSLIFRARTFFGSFQVNGLILAITTLINIKIFISNKKVIYLMIALLNFIGLNCSCARGPLVAFFLSLLILLIVDFYKQGFELFHNMNILKRNVILCTLFFIIIVITICIVNDITFNIPALEFFFQRVKSIFNWSVTENSNTTRTGVWSNSINIFLSHPIIGIGISSTGSGDLGTLSIGVTESGLLKRLVEVGLIGFTLFYTFFLSIIIFNFKKIKTSFIQFCKTNLIYICIIICICIEDVTLQITEDFVVSFFLYFSIACICQKCGLFTKRKEDN